MTLSSIELTGVSVATQGSPSKYFCTTFSAVRVASA